MTLTITLPKLALLAITLTAPGDSAPTTPTWAPVVGDLLLVVAGELVPGLGLALGLGKIALALTAKR